MTQYFVKDPTRKFIGLMIAPLHFAVANGAEPDVIALLESEKGGKLYRSRFPDASGTGEWSSLATAKSTPLHLALLHTHYDLAERLLHHEGLDDIIDLKNQWGTSLFSLITGLPDKQKALQFTQYVLERLRGKFDINATDNMRCTALHYACQDLDEQMISLLLENGVDANLCAAPFIQAGKTPLLEVAGKLLKMSPDDPQSDKARQIIRRLLENGADPALRDTDGRNLFDYFHSEASKALLDDDIRSKLGDWRHSTPFESARHRFVYTQTYPLSHAIRSNELSPSLENTALLVSLKRERRLANNQDYDCTVLSDKRDLKAFLALCRLQFEQTGQPFTTQFIIQPYVDAGDYWSSREENVHVANAQLSIDERGKATVFWVDSLGANQLERRPGHETISGIIRSFFPDARLYTVYEQLIRSASGCHNFALYLSEQLSAAPYKHKNLPADLVQAYDAAKHPVIHGFMPVALEDCPAYTGIPRIVHSASAPLERLQQNREEDREILNKKHETYQSSMERVIKIVDGKKTNTLFDIKRHRFGRYLAQSLTEEYNTPSLAEKKLSGFTHIVDRMDPAILQKRYPCPLDIREGRCTIELVHNERMDDNLCYANIDELEADVDRLLLVLGHNPGMQANLLNRYAELRSAKAQIAHYKQGLQAERQSSFACSSTFFAQEPSMKAQADDVSAPDKPHTKPPS